MNADPSTDPRDLLTRAATVDDVIALLDPPHVAALAAYSDDELALDLARARRIRGAATYVDMLRSALRASRSASPPPLREGNPEADSLREWLATHGCPVAWLPSADAGIMPPYLLADGRVLRSREDTDIEVVPGVIAVVGRCRDPETERIALDVVWCYHGQWTRRTVDRGQVMTRDGALGMAADGAPIDQSCATQAVAWLHACDAAIPGESRPALSRMGWLPDGSGYAWGDTPIGRDLSVIPPGQGEREELARYSAGGTLAEWRRQVWEAVREEPAEIVVLAALAAPLLHVLGPTGWTLDVGGERGSGKTTAMRAAASVWGSRVIVPWPRTWAAMRSVVEFRADIPAFLDDTKHAASWDHVRALLYQVSDERAQTLGSGGGGTRGNRLVRTIVISSGESTIAEHCQAAQGGAHRILTLGCRPFPPGHRQHVQAIERASADHYGHAGPALVRWLVDHRDRWGALRDRWTRIGDEIATKYPGDEAGRLSLRVAMLRIASELAAEVLGLTSTGTALEDFTAHAMGGIIERDAPAEALRHVVAYITARPSQVVGWADDRSIREPYLAQRFDGGDLHLVGSELGPILESGGYDPVEIRRQWQTRGWLARADPGRDGRPRTDTRASVMGRTMRVVVVSAQALEDL